MNTAPPKIDLLEKLLRRALDPAAMDGEAKNSAEKFVTIARHNGIHFDALADALAASRRLPPPKIDTIRPPQRPPACDTLMPFGKYKGETLEEIARHDAGYLEWIINDVEKPWLCAAAGAVLDWFIGREAA